MRLNEGKYVNCLNPMLGTLFAFSSWYFSFYWVTIDIGYLIYMYFKLEDNEYRISSSYIGYWLNTLDSSFESLNKYSETYFVPGFI